MNLCVLRSLQKFVGYQEGTKVQATYALKVRRDNEFLSGMKRIDIMNAHCVLENLWDLESAQ